MLSAMEMKLVTKINKLTFWLKQNIDNDNEKFDNAALLAQLFNQVETLQEFRRLADK
ncbi:MAG: hypothetical protein ACRC6A_10305 [Fusobacteriaceae bacterium]